MVWFAGGHDGGDPETARLTSLTEQWFDRWLKPAKLPLRPGQSGGRLVTGQPGFAVSRDLGYDPSSNEVVLGIATAAGYPGLGGTRHDAGAPGRARPDDREPAGRRAAVDVGLARASARWLVRLGPPRPAARRPAASASTCPARARPSSPRRWPGRFRSPARRRCASGSAARARPPCSPRSTTSTRPATRPCPTVSPRRCGSPPGPRARSVTVRLPAIDYDFAAGHRLRAGADHDRLRLCHLAGAGHLPGGAGRRRPVAACRSRAAGRGRRGALVDLGGAAGRAGRRGGDPAGRPPPDPGHAAAGPGRGAAGDRRADQALPRWPAGRRRPLVPRRARPDPGAARAERSRQDLDPAHPDGPAAPGRRARSRSSAGGSIRGRRRCPGWARSWKARVSCRTCPGGPTSSCTGGPPAARRPTRAWRRCSRSRAWGRPSTARSAPTRAACASGWPLPRPCWACRTCWCSTSR